MSPFVPESPFVPDQPGPVRTVLVTGLSGAVGTALAPELRRHRLLALTRRDTVPAGVEAVRGDLTAPDLGLAAADYAALAEQVDVVVHAGAVTDFRADQEAVNQANVAGTGQIIRLAERAGATLHYLSTAFVARAELARAEVRDAAADPTRYLASKRAAEELVRGCAVPATVVRPSVVIGHSITGATSRFQGLHLISAAIMRGAMPLLPLDPVALIDIMPADVLARALAGLVEAEHTGVREYWVTAGEQALTTGRIVELLVEVGQRLGLSSIRPRLVRPDMVDRLVRPVFIDPLPLKIRRQFDDMVSMTALFAGAEPFPSDLATMPGGCALTRTALERALAASAEYLVHTKGWLTRSNRVAA